MVAAAAEEGVSLAAAVVAGIVSSSGFTGAMLVSQRQNVCAGTEGTTSADVVDSADVVPVVAVAADKEGLGAGAVTMVL